MTALALSSIPSLSSGLGAALRGLPGRVVDAIDPYTEADPAAVLVTFLAAYGSCVGSGPHALVGADVHRANLFAVLVGKSSKSRKGSSWSPVRTLFDLADHEWTAGRIVSGLGSGEGLVAAVRDAVERDGQILDPGEPDKRAHVLATEFAAVLRVVARQGSTLSPVLRDAWDRGDLRVTTKNTPLRATGAHVSVLAHITEDELRRELSDTETANGFGNRFLWIGVGRSKMLPEPEPFDAAAVAGLARELEHSLYRARQIGRVDRDDDARAMWRTAYPVLSRDRYGLAGTLTDRAEAQVLRLSLIYALTDGSAVIRGEHLESALALWQHAEDCAVRLFGDSTGDALADRIAAGIRARGQMTRTEIRELAGHAVTASRIQVALSTLEAVGRVRRWTIETGGRPAEIWEETEQTEQRPPSPRLSSVPSIRSVPVSLSRDDADFWPPPEPPDYEPDPEPPWSELMQ